MHGKNELKEVFMEGRNYIAVYKVQDHFIEIRNLYGAQSTSVGTVATLYSVQLTAVVKTQVHPHHHLHMLSRHAQKKQLYSLRAVILDPYFI
jgi:hypothetical protein